MLMVVSHPDSPGYGKHWSATDLVDKFKPTTQTAEDVVRWLVDSGIPRDRLALSINRGWIHFNATTAQVEELLKTEYYVFTHEDSGAEQISAKFPLTIIYSFLIIKAVKVIQSHLVWKDTLTGLCPPLILITYPPQWSSASIVADSALWNPGKVPIEWKKRLWLFQL